MAHNHNIHNHKPNNLDGITRAFYLGIGLNVVYTVIEFMAGYYYDSLALLADASHNLSDIVSLIISLVGLKLGQKAATKLFTYRYRKTSILASFINSVLLIAIAGYILFKAFERLNNVHIVGGKAIIIVALIGVAINSLSAYLFYKDQKHDINIKGAFLHLLVDALVSVGVVISGVIIYYTDWFIVDTIISFFIAIIILIATWNLFKTSLRLILDGIPEGIDYKDITTCILETDGVLNTHHLHIWGLSSTENALSAHITCPKDLSMEETRKITTNLKHKLQHKNIHHISLEFECENDECLDHNC